MRIGWPEYFYILLHFSFSFWLVFLFLPRYIFDCPDDRRMENAIALYIRMVFLVIVVGYLLVFLKLYELTALCLVFLILIYRRHNQKGLDSNWKTHMAEWQLRFLDVLEHPDLIKTIWKQAKQSGFFRRKLNVLRQNIEWTDAVYTVILFIILGYSAYLRFYDAFIHAAPPMTDAYTTLAWMKNIIRRIAFYNQGGGIYPRGLSIYMATLKKFAGIDALPILKLVGPFNSLMIVYGIYFSLSRFTKDRTAGLAGAAMYGIFGFLLFGGDWDRHAATNSQEFALVFVLPAWFYFDRYLRQENKYDWWVGFSALAITGFTHTLVFGYIWIIMAILALVMILCRRGRKYFPTVWPLAKAVIFALVLSVIPLLIGVISGVGLHESSVEFAEQKSVALHYPLLHWCDWAALIGLGLCGIRFVFRPQNWRVFDWEKTTLLLGLATFLIYYAGGPLTGSLMLATRMGVFWSLMTAFLIGYGWYAVWKYVKSSPGGAFAETIVFSAVLSGMVYWQRPPVIEPYKMEWDSAIVQYYRIDSLFRPLTWIIVSQEDEFAIVLGEGFHIFHRDFLSYNPVRLEKRKWLNLPENILIYYYKNIFKVKRSNVIYAIEEPKYQRMAREMPLLQQWITRYRSAHHGGIKIFYEDRNMCVYYLKNPFYHKNVWGD